ncbi:hypothetical protein FPZ12_016550 [Amycolatopsis acidicola]|uniref:Major royal jelly protein n=1 Tax=Amycolatopsis acidicola TaxID=2596893 RepID=A0A5N0V6U4_9PSEU|nr:L-dopachrome tautomerase-related protein [Amycolatopsis acidicola]KAA9160751.1 hypothetical protein FPZ12_016550 [Amycolatopsis acidicola]
MRITRRQFGYAAGVFALGAAGGCARSSTAESGSTNDPQLPLTVAATSPWMANQVALTSDGTMFLGLPRFPGHEQTPSVARRGPDGAMTPFPGNGWNEWKAGDDGQNAFVYVNSLHIFADDTVWVVDQGGLRPDASPPELSTPKPGAQKVVQLDPKSGNVLRVLRFGADILPAGAQLNDLRISGDVIYLTDSGVGALIVHDLATGKTLRRLSGHKEMLAVETPAPTTSAAAGSGQNKHKTPKSDMIELSADGVWLYWAAPTGPFRRIRTDILRDPSVSDDALAGQVEQLANIPLSGGCTIDTKGNLYLSDIDNKRILLLPPSGKIVTLATDNRLLSPDGSFIGGDRTLYVPAPQTRLTQLFGNPRDLTTQPFQILSLRLPETFDGTALGDAVTGRRV